MTKFTMWKKVTKNDLTIIDIFNVIVFIRATDHVITMLCHVTKN